MATFTGSAGNDTANATTGTLSGFTVTGGSGNDLADLQDNVGDTINGNGGSDTVVAGSGANSVNGGGGNDSIDGGAGNDFLRGFSGVDVLNGGAGTDEIYFEGTTQGTQAVSVNLATGAVIDEFGNAETITNFEIVRGTRFADTLTGGNPANGAINTAFGLNDGFEGFRGLAGNDTINGGSGYDELRYDRDVDNVTAGGAFGTGAVIVNLSSTTQFGVAANSARDGFNNIDTLTSIEGARGTTQADTMVGGVADNTFIGLGGNDSLIGGDGFDSVNYDVGSPGSGVTVNLATGTASDGFGGTDSLSGIQGVRGTSFADTFTGSDFVGFFGDGFQGLAGNDTINGGAGLDEVRYDNDVDFGGAGAVVVNLSTTTQLGVAAGTARDGFNNTDTLTGLENARGTSGADSFFGGTSNNSFRGLAGNDTFTGGDGDGNDTANYDRDRFDGGTGAIVFNLSGATVLGVASGTARDGFGNIDTLIGIESARGSNTADTLIGSSGDRNGLMGFAGNDTLDGGAGVDDEVRYDVDAYEGGAAAVNVNFATGLATDGFGNTDTIAGFEIARGTQGNDTFTGGAGDDTFRGLGGNDTLNGGSGGSDWASYNVDVFARQESQTLAGVIVNLSAATAFGVASNTALDSFGNTDTLISIENAAGGGLADRLIGSGGDNSFRGLAGADTMDGGLGNDTVDYSIDNRIGQVTFLNGANAVNVNLAGGTATDGFGATDTLISIENAIGTEFDDTLAGSSAANRLDGGAGNDTLTGSTGNDTVLGGDGGDRIVATHADGNDTITGGNGFDILDYSAVNGVVQVNQLAGTTTGSAGNDTLLDVIEQVIGTNFDDVLSGGNGINILDGNGGADQFFGNGGDDLLRGGAGADIFWSNTNDGNDRMQGDDGDDTIHFANSDGNDTLTGGNGFDILDYSSLNGVVQVNQLAGTTTGTAGNDTLLDIFEMVIGTNFGDVLSGGHGINSLKGNGGDDQIFANNGDDYVDGGAGNDTVALGVGNDVFDFRNGGNVDTLTDFTAGGTDDHVELHFYSGLGIADFAALQASGRLSTVSGHAELALNGGDKIIFQNVASHTSLTAADFTF